MKYEQEMDEKVNLLNKLKQELELTKADNDMLKVENSKLYQSFEQNK